MRSLTFTRQEWVVLKSLLREIIFNGGIESAEDGKIVTHKVGATAIQVWADFYQRRMNQEIEVSKDRYKVKFLPRERSAISEAFASADVWPVSQARAIAKQLYLEACGQQVWKNPKKSK